MAEDNPNVEKEEKKETENIVSDKEQVESASVPSSKTSEDVVVEDKVITPQEEGKSEVESGKSVIKHIIPPPPPPSPKAKSRFLSSRVNAEKSLKIDDGNKGKYDKNFAADLNLPPKFLETKVIAGIVVGVMIIGAVFGAVFSGGGSCPPCSDVNFGVVRNSEIVRTVKRCGIAEPWEQCRLLIPNPSRDEQKARALYQRASSLSDVPLYKIDAVNIRYANEIIKPGYIAEIKVPPRDN